MQSTALILTYLRRTNLSRISQRISSSPALNSKTVRGRDKGGKKLLSYFSLSLSLSYISKTTFRFRVSSTTTILTRKTVASGVRVAFLSMLREINSWPRPGEFYESDKSSASAYLPPPGYALMENVFILPLEPMNHGRTPRVTFVLATLLHG